MSRNRAFAVPLLALALGTPTTAVTTDTEAEHCVVVVVEQAADGELITTDPECFGTKSAALAYAEWQTAVRTPGGTALATFTLGTHYDGLSGTGSSISVVGSSCSGGHWNTPSSWDNRISSTRNGCNRVKHHDYPNKGGSYASTWGVGVLSNVPSYMNNRAESVSYWTS